MAKKETLKKQKKLKKNTYKLKKFDPQETFRKMKSRDLSKVLFEIWMDRDIDSFKSVLSTYLEVHNKQKIANAMGVSRNTLYQMVTEEGNPTLDTIFKLLDAIEKEVA